MNLKHTIRKKILVCILLSYVQSNMSCVVKVTLIYGGGNQRTQRKPPSCHKSLTKLYHIMLYTSPWSRFKLTTSVVIGTDCLGSCKSNYHMITTTMAPIWYKMYFEGKLNLRSHNTSYCVIVVANKTDLTIILLCLKWLTGPLLCMITSLTSSQPSSDNTSNSANMALPMLSKLKLCGFVLK